MSLTIKHLNGDASFLLTFAPVGQPEAVTEKPFRILLDPWLVGTSVIGHALLSTSTHVQPSCVASLRDLPTPDLVLVSQHNTDHCHKETLRQLLPLYDGNGDAEEDGHGQQTPLLLAEPAAAEIIRSWSCFPEDRVRPMTPWTPQNAVESVLRFPVHAGHDETIQPGEVTVAYVQQQKDPMRVHGAIAITYRPPCVDDPKTKTKTEAKALSVLFSPHGTDYHNLAPLATHHLSTIAALPLTALLHCFDTVRMAVARTDVALGAPGGYETAARLAPQAWIAAHDGPTTLRGLSRWLLRTRQHEIAETREGIAAMRKKMIAGKASSDEDEVVLAKADEEMPDMDVRRMASGEEIILKG